jgi:4-hydroxybenzoate polyprenyltransferase
VRKNNSIAILDFLFVLRPILFFPGWSTMLAGYFVAVRNTWIFENPGWIYSDFWFIIRLMILFAAAMGACFLLNQLQDVDSDRRNNKLFIIAEGCIGFRAVTIEIIFLIAMALIMAFSLSTHTGMLIAGFILITGYLYNFKPFGLKDRPWGSLASNCAMGWLAFAIGWSAGRSLDVQLIIDSLPYLFLNTALYLFTTLPDREGDAQTGKRTLAVVFGIKFIVVISFILYLIGGLSAILLKDRLAILIVRFSLPFFVITMWQKNEHSPLRATKFTILIFGLIICLIWPWYFILMILAFFFTRWYFKKRFDYDYPNFKSS